MNSFSLFFFNIYKKVCQEKSISNSILVKSKRKQIAGNNSFMFACPPPQSES